MLELQSIQKTFHKNSPDQHVALNGLSLTVQPGDFISIIGGNGAGKSTLFNAVCGTLLLDGGKIILDGEDITYQKEHNRAKNIGRLFQDPLKGTAPSMTIEENLMLAHMRSLKNSGIKGRKPASDFYREKLAELNLGLEDRMKTQVKNLSGGQRQAITLLMATIASPKLLLLDEHTAALDPAAAEKIMSMTEKIINRNKITALMITHKLSAALSYGNRTIMMDSGSIVLDVSGEQRVKLTAKDLLEQFKEKSKKALDNDRILLS